MTVKPKVVFASAVVAIAAIAGYYYASPWITLNNLRSDAMAGKADKMSEYVDFPSLRESLKSQIQAVMMGSLSKPELKDNPFSGLAMVMAGSIVEGLVNTMASPNGIVNMVQGKDLREGVAAQPSASASGPDSPAPTKAFNGSVNYDGLSRVIVKGKDAKPDAPYIVMKREGLFSWKVVDIQLGKFENK